MKRKVIITALLILGTGLMVAAFCNEANAEESQVCLKDGSGVKCLKVQTGAPAINAGRVNALLARAAKLRKQIAELAEAGNGKAGDVTADVVDLKKKLADMEKVLQQLDGDAKSGKTDAKTALDKLNKLNNLENELKLLGKELAAHRKALRALLKTVRRLEKCRVNLELGGFGAIAYKYGAEGGALVSLALPMGGVDGLWTTRLTAGLGVSPSIGLGWLAMGTLSRSLGTGEYIEIGPAILGMGDEGGLIDGHKNWLFGGGAELRLHLSRSAHLTVTPFVGVTVKNTQVGVGQWIPTGNTPSIPNCPCSGGSSGYWTGGVKDGKCVGFTGGALATITFPLF